MLLASGNKATAESGEKVRETPRVVVFLEEVSPADGVLSSILAVSKAQRNRTLGIPPCLHRRNWRRSTSRAISTRCWDVQALITSPLSQEAHPGTMFPAKLGGNFQVFGQQCGDVQVLVEQYLDFVAQPHVPGHGSWFTGNAHR